MGGGTAPAAASMKNPLPTAFPPPSPLVPTSTQLPTMVAAQAQAQAQRQEEITATESLELCKALLRVSIYHGTEG